jgi:hypothetical protein
MTVEAISGSDVSVLYVQALFVFGFPSYRGVWICGFPVLLFPFHEDYSRAVQHSACDDALIS